MKINQYDLKNAGFVASMLALALFLSMQSECFCTIAGRYKEEENEKALEYVC